MEGLIPFFIVLLAVLLSSQLFKRLHIPWVVGLIFAGILIGPNGLDVFEPDTTITFIGQVGLIFLMFMAGLETKLSSLKHLKSGVSSIALLNGGIPFLVGVFAASMFGYGFSASLLIGIIFISSSIAVIIPALERNGLINSRIGTLIIGSSIVEDIASLVLLSVFLQNINPVTILPLPVFYVLVVVAIFFLRWIIVKVHNLLSFKSVEGDVLQAELRLVFAIMIGTVITFEFLGLHPIIAGFFAGLVLSESITGSVVREKIRTIGYGLFIPIFFVVVGMNTNLGVLTDMSQAGILVLVIVLGSIFSKLISGYLAGRSINLSARDSMLIGATKIPQLTTTLAAAFAGLELGILDEELVVAMVILSAVSTVVGLLFIKYLDIVPNETIQPLQESEHT